MRCCFDQDIDDESFACPAVAHGLASATCGPKQNSVPLPFSGTSDSAD